MISEKANQVFHLLKQTCFNSGLPTYDQKTHQGFFRHLVIREGVNTGELLVNLSVAEHTLTPEQKTLREQLQHTFSTNPLLREQITSFVITANASLADTVRNEQSKNRILRGKGSIEEMLNGVRFRVSPFSFFQTNTHGAEKLFLTAFTMLGDFEGNILDLYCGTGSIGLSLLSLSQKTSSPKKESGVIGIEIVEDAIRDANINAELNGLSAFSSFYASPAEKALERFPELAGKIKNL